MLPQEPPPAIRDLVHRRVLLATRETKAAAFGAVDLKTTYWSDGANFALAIGPSRFQGVLRENYRRHGDPLPWLIGKGPAFVVVSKRNVLVDVTFANDPGPAIRFKERG